MKDSEVTLENVRSLNDEDLERFVPWADAFVDHAYELIFTEPDYDGFRISSCSEGGVEDDCLVCTAEDEKWKRERDRKRTLPGNSVISSPLFMGLRAVKDMELGSETYLSLGGFHGKMTSFTVALKEKKSLENGYYLLTWEMTNRDALDGSTPGEAFTTKEFTVALHGEHEYSITGKMK